MKSFLACILWLLSTSLSVGQQPTVASGTLVRHANFASKYVAARNVDVWLPAGYSAEKKYAVLYMQDGQMLFDSTTTWNKQEWGVDETLGTLLTTRRIRDCLVVAIWNVPANRFADYFPEKVIGGISEPTRATLLTQQLKGTPTADNYLKFLVTELKPFIDRAYSTRKNAVNTFIMGSSMGGLISMYAICEYPAVFGGAACLSTHWPGIFSMENNPIPDAFVSYLKAKLPDPKHHKLYFDYGDQTLDALYPPLQKKVDLVMTEKGYTATSWTTQFFPGKDHSETSWHERLAIPLDFLLTK